MATLIPSVRRSQFSPSRIYISGPQISDIIFATQLKKEREKPQLIMTDADSSVRFHLLYYTLFFPHNVLLLRAGAILISFHYLLSFGHETASPTRAL